MNFNHTFTILFWLHKSKINKKGFVSIWVRITIDGKRAECSTSRQILPEHWDSEAGQPVANYYDAQSLNHYMLFVKAEITKHYNMLISSRDFVTAEDVKNSYKGIREKVVMFTDVFKQYNQLLEERKDSNDLCEGRYKKFPLLLEKCKRS